MADRPDGVHRRRPDADEDDWFRNPSVGSNERDEVAWHDEPDLRRPRPTAGSGRRPAVLLLAVVGGIALLVGGILAVRALTGSGTTPHTGGSPTVPTTTAPAQTTTSPTVTTPPNIATVPTTGTLRSGNTGGAVRRLQQALTKLGYSTGAADGNFGPSTLQAVIAFQKAHSLPQDGVAGAKTLAVINAALRP